MKYVIDLPDAIKLKPNRPFEYSDKGVCLCVYDPERIEPYKGRGTAIKVGNIILYEEDIVAVILAIDCEDELTIFNENGCVEVICPDEIDMVLGSTDLIDKLIKLLQGESQ